LQDYLGFLLLFPPPSRIYRAYQDLQEFFRILDDFQRYLKLRILKDFFSRA